MGRNSLLIGGIVSMLWYIAMNIITPIRYPGYDPVSQTISELSAIDAPSRMFWVVLSIFYSLFLAAFGLGVWLSANGNHKLQFVGAVILFDAIFGFFWPPMHQREVIAAGGGTLTDTLHLVWAFVHLGLMLLMIGFGASIFGKGFRIFSIATVLVFMVFGVLTTRESLGIETGAATPAVGIWERINIGAYMLWIVLFSILLIRRNNRPGWSHVVSSAFDR